MNVRNQVLKRLVVLHSSQNVKNVVVSVFTALLENFREVLFLYF